MTDTYDKINHWYGWNGGERPVHPDTEVEVLEIDGSDSGKAGKLQGWGAAGEQQSIVAFQIISLAPRPSTVKREVALYRSPSGVRVAATCDEPFHNLRRISEPVTIELTLLPEEQP